MDDYAAVKSKLFKSLRDTSPHAARQWWSITKQSDASYNSIFLRLNILNIRRLDEVSTKRELGQRSLPTSGGENEDQHGTRGIYLVLIMVFITPKSQTNTTVSLAASQKQLYVTIEMKLDISGQLPQQGLPPSMSQTTSVCLNQWETVL